MNPRALQMIEEALGPMIRSGCRIERIKLVVCPTSLIASFEVIRTKFGDVKVEPDDLVRKGLSFLMEDPGRKGRGFVWVSGYTPDVQKKQA
ncbi:hypothetical protein D3C87_993880 [compost metagenome]